MNKSFQFNTVLILEIPSCHVHLQKSIYFVTPLQFVTSNIGGIFNSVHVWQLVTCPNFLSLLQK